MKPLRWPALLLVPVLLLAAVFASNDPSDGVEAAADAPLLGPRIARPGALSALWFCSGGTGVDGGPADHTVVLANTTDTERSVSLSVFGSRLAGGGRAEPVTRTLTLGGHRHTDVRLGDLVAAPYVSAIVEVDGGGVLAEHRVSGPLGSHQAPCASQVSGQWSVPLGATSIVGDSAPVREVLVFFNPFPGDAVLDVEFSTDSGFRGTPQVFRGLVVPGSGVVAVDLAQAGVTVAREVAATVTARTGRVVVDRLGLFDQPPDRRGLLVSSGVPGAARVWIFPAGRLGNGREERLVVANLTDVPAEIDVEVRPDDPEMSTEPFEITVRARQHVTIDLAAEPRLASFVERGTRYSIVVRSANGVPVTAERLIAVRVGAAGAGTATSTGAAVAATRLAVDVPAGHATGSELVLLNPSLETIAIVSLSILADGSRSTPARFSGIELQPGGRITVPLSELGSGRFTVFVEATSGIVVERELVVGSDRSSGVAVAEATSSAPFDLDALSGPTP
jgi:hypothetical protein